MARTCVLALCLAMGGIIRAEAQTPRILPEGVPDFSADTSRVRIESVANGDWSSPSTWQGAQIPTANNVVLIRPEHTITVSNQAAVAYTVAIDGTLRFAPNANTRLTVTNLQVMAGLDGMGTPGVLEVGTVANPIAANVTAEIVIADTPLGGGVSDPEQFGTGMIAFGKVVMHGSVKTPTFARLAAEPRAGHTTLTLSEPVSGWRPGDRIVLPDTRHIKESETVPDGWVNAVNQWEERTLTAVSPDGRTLTLNAALTFDHLGARDFAGALEFLPHVGNLGRNVIVKSENATGSRGHFVGIHMADIDIRYALFRDLGRTTFKPLKPLSPNQIGRYPVHIHHVSGPIPNPANGHQFTLTGNAIDGGSQETQFKWGIAVHGSHYGLIKDNVVYNYNGAAIATEDGSESFNVFDHNFVLRGMGEPNNQFEEARSALFGSEGVGFWFRGPNNIVTNNVAANFQNSTTEAAYGFVFQFRFLGDVKIPNFQGADTMGLMGPNQFTLVPGNSLPLLKFEGNEAYGAMQGGLTYWWISSLDPQPFANAGESVIKNFTAWHVYNKGVYIYPGAKVTFDGLKIRGNYSATARCCGDGIFFADYMAKDIVVRNSDIQGMEQGIIAPMAGFGPNPNLTIENTYLRNWENVAVPAVGSVNGCWMDNKLVVLINSHLEMAPGMPANHIAMVGDVARVPALCLTKLSEMRVYSYNGNAADNFQVYHPDPTVLPRPPTDCVAAPHPGVNGPACVIPGLMTASLSATPQVIDAGQSTTLTWTTANATTVFISPAIGFAPASGSAVVFPAVTTTYTLTAGGAAGELSTTTMVRVRTTVPITWNAPADIAYGTPLGATQLNANVQGTTVFGTFAYSPAANSILPVGTHTLSVTFTPTDLDQFLVSTRSVQITVTRATPVITWAPPAILYGTLLGAAQLNATATSNGTTVPGTLAYTPPVGTMLTQGTHQLSVAFTPENTTSYTSATKTVSITVNENTVITWAPPANIAYGTPLGAAQLNATATALGVAAPGTLSYTLVAGGANAAGAVLNAGTHLLLVEFTPANPASHSIASASVPITVTKATPSIAWVPTPTSIVVGTPLSASQLNASTAAAGAFGNYTSGAGAVVTVGSLLPVGPHTLSVTFTPLDLVNYLPATATVPIIVTNGVAAPPVMPPVKIGNQIAGTYGDATGHSGQSHLVYAPNAGVWWLFTLSSAHDALGDRTVQTYVSSGPDLGSATWTAAAVSPTLGNTNGATSSRLAGGRSLGVAVRSINGVDYAHVFISAAFDGQNSSNGHSRATLGTTSIAWGAWNNPGSPNTASEWQGPLGTGNSSASSKTPWGNSIGISTSGYIHHFSVVMDQEVDCNVGRSTNPDNAATWVNGFGNNVSPTGNTGTSPPWTTAVIDKTMTFECKALAFAPLASDVMLAVYTNGAVAQPNASNLRYQRSGTGASAGVWTNIPGNGGGGNGNVFSTNIANMNQNDWALVPVSATTVYVFRRNSTGSAVQMASYSAAGNGWSTLTGPNAPPAFGTGQSMKAGAGVFGATDGTSVWLFVINGSDTSNSILYTKLNAGTWTSWAVVPGTNSGTHTRNFIAGYPKPNSNGQIGLVWSEPISANFDVYAATLNTSAAGPAPTATITAPAAASTVSGIVSVSATATPGSGTVSGVQFVVDGVNLGAEDTSNPYEVSLDTTTLTNGAHFVSAVVRDSNGGIGVATAISITVVNDKVAPTVAMTVPAGGSTGTKTVLLSANASDDIGVAGVQFLLDGVALLGEVTTPPYYRHWDTLNVAPGVHTLSARARDASGRSTTSAAVSITVIDSTPPSVTPPNSIGVPATEYAGARGNVLGSVGSQQLNALLAGGSAMDGADAAPLKLPTEAMFVNGTWTEVDANTLFPYGNTAVRFSFRDASGNVGRGTSVVTVTARIPDEPTVKSTVSIGGGRLRNLQNFDGGWPFRVGSAGCAGTGSCPNTFGIIALGLLATEAQVGGGTMHAPAIAAGDALIGRYNIAIAQTPKETPYNQDIEFLVGLTRLTGAPIYESIAQSWFQVTIDRYPTGANRADDIFARRTAGRLRTLAVWDVASMIRAAKAVGRADYAQSAAARVVELEATWKDTDPTHRWDQCSLSGGCGPVDNPMAFDYTLLGMGSMLWAIHDLPGFDATINAYRSYLVQQQDPAGSWDNGNLQISAYAAIGLASVGGGASTDAAINAAATHFLANEKPTGGWPFSTAAGSSGAEYTQSNAEIVRAMSMLFSTPAGENVAVTPAQLSTVTFSEVGSSGVTTVVIMDDAATPVLSAGFEVVGGLAYEVTTTADISGDIVTCFSVPWITDPLVFNDVRIMHGENGVMVDRTILAPDAPAPDFATRRVCARTQSLSPFAIALELPDTLPPNLTVPSDSVVEATGPAGAPFNFLTSAIDDIAGDVAVDCVPASGHTFPFGVTAVECSASDGRGNTATASFNVTVRDTSPPVVTVPADVTLGTNAPSYSFDASAFDAVDGSVPTVCTPPSGTKFAKGTTTVVCQATDSRGHAGSASFTVTVKPGAGRKNRAPEARSADYEMKPNSTLTGVLQARDPDGDQLVFELVEQPTGGEFSLDPQTGAFTYASGPRDDERVELRFRVGDGEEWSRTERVRIRSRNK